MAPSASPFKKFSELYPGGSSSQIRTSALDAGTHSTSLQTLADDLTGDGRTASHQVSGDLLTLVQPNVTTPAGRARTLSANGHFASGVLLDFAGDVETFDSTVESLNAEYRRRLGRAQRMADQEPDEPYDAVATGNSIKASLQPQYDTAESKLDTAATSAASRLRTGVTDESVRELMRAGLIPLSAQSSFPTVTLTPADISAAETNGGQVANDLLKFLGLLPGGDSPRDLVGYGFGLAGLGFGTFVDWRTTIALSTFKPNFTLPNGMMSFAKRAPYLGFNPSAIWMRTKAVLTPGTQLFMANPNRAASRGAWSTAGKWATRAGGVVTAVTAGWSQWEEDADDPTLSDGDRTGRTVTTGASTALGAMGGAKVGAMGGAAIGTMICPGVGTVIGGAIGGIAGGAIGAWGGEKIGDFVNEQFDDAVENVGDGLNKVGGAIADGASKLKFW